MKGKNEEERKIVDTTTPLRARRRMRTSASSSSSSSWQLLLLTLHVLLRWRGGVGGGGGLLVCANEQMAVQRRTQSGDHHPHGGRQMMARTRTTLTDDHNINNNNNNKIDDRHQNLVRPSWIVEKMRQWLQQSQHYYQHYHRTSLLEEENTDKRRHPISAAAAAESSSSLSPPSPPFWQWWRRKRKERTALQQRTAMSSSDSSVAVALQSDYPAWQWWRRRKKRNHHPSSQSSISAESDDQAITSSSSSSSSSFAVTAKVIETSAIATATNKNIEKKKERKEPWWRRRHHPKRLLHGKSDDTGEVNRSRAKKSLSVSDHGKTTSSTTAGRETTSMTQDQQVNEHEPWWKKLQRSLLGKNKKNKGEISRSHDSSVVALLESGKTAIVLETTRNEAHNQKTKKNESSSTSGIVKGDDEHQDDDDHAYHHHHHHHHHHRDDEDDHIYDDDDDDDDVVVGAMIGHARLLQCRGGGDRYSIQRQQQQQQQQWWRRVRVHFRRRVSRFKHFWTPGRQPIRRRRHRRRREAHVRMAYRMAVLSALAYWEFYKRPWPVNHDYGFRLLLPNQPSTQPKQRRRDKLKQWFYCRVVDSTIVAGVESMIGVVNDHYQPKQDDETISANALSSRRPTCRSYVDKNDRSSSSSGIPTDNNDDSSYTRLEYYFHNWHEPTAVGANWHDTDLLVSTTTATPFATNKKNSQKSSQASSSLVLSFSGTSSPADALTDLQTFEPIQHSGLFTTNYSDITGSVHRGFLNAYSRVKHGSVLRLCHDDNEANKYNHNENKCRVPHSPDDKNFEDDDRNSLIQSLHERYGHCSVRSSTTSNNDGSRETTTTAATKSDGNRIKVRKDSASDVTTTAATIRAYVNETDHTSVDSQNDSKQQPSPPKGEQHKFSQHTVMKRRKNGSCHHYERDHNAKLMDVLRELVTNALANGRAVHITGHSLGGGLAIILVLDIILNFPIVPIDHLHLWTFGAPQVVDDAFLASAMQACPRLESYIRSANGHEKNRRRDSSDNGNGRLHRFVTLTNDCEMDFVSTIASQALSPDAHTSVAEKEAIHRQDPQQQRQQKDNHSKKDLRAILARRLGGVHGSLVHVAEPYYLLPPSRRQQRQLSTTNPTTATATNNGTTSSSDSIRNTRSSNYSDKTTSSQQQDHVVPPPPPPTLLSSNTVVEIHRTMNYLQGISQESMDHPLMSDLPVVVQNMIGEYNGNPLTHS
jgi:Lipase (class 3)